MQLRHLFHLILTALALPFLVLGCKEEPTKAATEAKIQYAVAMTGVT